MENALTALFEQESVAQTLVLLDDYMDRVRKLGRPFQLPVGHVWMLPLIEAWTNALRGFRKFVKGVREDFSGRKDQYPALNDFYRRIDGRWTQQWLRARAGQAFAWLDTYHPGLRPADRKV